MDKKDDLLTNLWQSQPVESIDAEELKTLWHKNRNRQRWWILSDVIGGIFAVVLCLYFVLTDANLFKQIWAGVFLVLAIVVTPPVLKMRYRSLGNNVPTSEYLQRIIEQKINNIRIVRLSAWLCIFISVAYGLWSIGYFLYYDPNPNIYIYRVLRSSGFIMFMTLLMAFWGKHEINKNNRELERFSKLTQ